MKKILAVLLTIVMAFSLAAPAFAAAPAVDMDGVSASIGNVSEDASAAVDAAGSIYDSIKAEDYKAAIDGVFDFAAKLAKAIHTLVHTLADLFDFDCPFCDEDKAANDGEDAGKDDENAEPEAPRGEGAGIVVEDGSQTTFGGGEYYGDVYLQADVTVAEIIIMDLTADVNNLVVLNERNTVIISGGNFTLPEGGKLVIDNTDDLTTQICLLGEIYVNGELLTSENVDQYFENCENVWFY
ncbi:MAG: hypothetical protein IJB74_03720 [Clostridia bacterium]|nr:hypothetical protein [Clostridia bacterium]